MKILSKIKFNRLFLQTVASESVIGNTGKNSSRKVYVTKINSVQTKT